MSRLHGLLKKKKKPAKCGFCHIVIVKDDTHSGVFYKVDAEEQQGESGTIHQVGSLAAVTHAACSWIEHMVFLASTRFHPSWLFDNSIIGLEKWNLSWGSCCSY